MQSTEATLARRSLHERYIEAAGWITLSLPLLLYAVAAIKTSVNIPFEDDFDSIGDFVEHYASLQGILPRLDWILTAQHVQYKLIFMNAIVAVQYQLIGHTNYRALQLLGDLAMPAALAILWLLLARSRRPLAQRIWLFIAPCWIFLALRYSETINWTMSGLQNAAVIPLGLAAIFFATSSVGRSLAWTLVFLALSMAASASGFVVALVVLYLQLRGRRVPELISSLSVVLLLVGLYAIHYKAYMVYAPVSRSAAVKSLVLFPFAFLGNSANSPVQCVVLGLILAAGFIILVRRGWYRMCPGSFGGALFCLLTSVVVAAGRYRIGFEGALAGHYVMYSVLFIALEYIAVVRLFVPESLTIRSRWTAGLALTAFASILFGLWADFVGYRNLHGRQRNQITHLILWERHPDHLVLVPDEDSFMQRPEWLGIRLEFQQDLQRHIAEGLYMPPYSARDPLPTRPHSPASRGIEDEPTPSK